jgi:hypothetical protein
MDAQTKTVRRASAAWRKRIFRTSEMRRARWRCLRGILPEKERRHSRRISSQRGRRIDWTAPPPAARAWLVHHARITVVVGVKADKNKTSWHTGWREAHRIVGPWSSPGCFRFRPASSFLLRATRPLHENHALFERAKLPSWSRVSIQTWETPGVM